jgi:hypothetical protein
MINFSNGMSLLIFYIKFIDKYKYIKLIHINIFNK